jgi:hypothetical protein
VNKQLGESQLTNVLANSITGTAELPVGSDICQFVVDMYTDCLDILGIVGRSSSWLPFALGKDNGSVSGFGFICIWVGMPSSFVPLLLTLHHSRSRVAGKAHVQ